MTFEISGGELRLQIMNGVMPINSRNYDSEFPVQFEVETEISHTQGNKDGSEVSENIGAGIIANKPELSIGGGFKDFSEEFSSISSTQKYKYIAHQLTAKGSPDAPAWVFRAIPASNILRGALKKAASWKRRDKGEELYYPISVRCATKKYCYYRCRRNYSKRNH